MKESIFLILATLEVCLSVAFITFFVAGTLAVFGEIEFDNTTTCCCWWIAVFALICASAIAPDVRNAWDDMRDKYKND